MTGFQSTSSTVPNGNTSGQCLKPLFIRGDERDSRVGRAVSIHADVLHDRVDLQVGLHFPQGHVLARLQLDQILLSVNDLDASVLQDLANVPGLEVLLPVLGEEVLLGFLRHVVVTFGHVHPANHDLAPRTARIADGVAALLPVDDLDVNSLKGRSDVSSGQVCGVGDGSCGAGLGKTVT